MATSTEQKQDVLERPLLGEIVDSVYAFVNGVKDSIIGCTNACKIALK